MSKSNKRYFFVYFGAVVDGAASEGNLNIVTDGGHISHRALIRNKIVEEIYKHVPRTSYVSNIIIRNFIELSAEDFANWET